MYQSSVPHLRARHSAHLLTHRRACKFVDESDLENLLAGKKNILVSVDKCMNEVRCLQQA